jgi:DNA polymerase alpha subunit B
LNKLQIILIKVFLCRILNNDDDTKDDTPSTPTQNRQDAYSPIHDTPSLYGNVLASGKPANLVTPFSKRTNRFAVKFSINTIPDVENEKQELNHENEEDDDYSIVSKVVNRKRCSLVIHGSGPKPGCRFMYDRTEDRVCDFYHCS